MPRGSASPEAAEKASDFWVLNQPADGLGAEHGRRWPARIGDGDIAAKNRLSDPDHPRPIRQIHFSRVPAFGLAFAAGTPSTKQVLHIAREPSNNLSVDDAP